ncbi:MAG: sensor domain-containing diguanylate cyclase [Actinomycetota bacterium]|nr:sensor domain-containing diguanylate cyclase [Actinomycetota bacterium]
MTLLSKYGVPLRRAVIVLGATGASIGIFLYPFPRFSRVSLFVILLFLAMVHWNLTEGGLLSRLIYGFGGSFYLRNLLTTLAAFLTITLAIFLVNGFHTPLLSLYYIPIVFAAVRGGFRMSSLSSLLLAIILGLFFYFHPGVDRELLRPNLVHLVLFVVVGVVAGSIAGRLRRATTDLSALHEIGKTISSTLKLDEILNLILNIVFLDIEPDIGALFLVDKQSERLNLRAQRGIAKDVAENLRLAMEEGIPGWVVKSHEPLYISDLRHGSTLKPFVEEMRSVIAVPFLARNEVIGVLVVGKHSPRGFTHENLRFLEALAGQAASAVENAGLYRQAHQWAIRDGLTGIYNYRHFIYQLEEEISRVSRYGGAVSIILSDVDFFKRVNDTYGHLRGDEVLRGIAQLIDAQTREVDLVARYGGEEFVIILPETDCEDAFKVANKLRETVAGTVFWGDEEDAAPVRVTISLGVASYPATASSQDELMKQADSVLYEAKIHRNTVCSILERQIFET